MPGNNDNIERVRDRKSAAFENEMRE